MEESNTDEGSESCNSELDDLMSPQRKRGRPSIASEFPTLVPEAIRLIQANGAAAQARRRTETITSHGVSQFGFKFFELLDFAQTSEGPFVGHNSWTSRKTSKVQ
jgi:hypothetical protein